MQSTIDIWFTLYNGWRHTQSAFRSEESHTMSLSRLKKPLMWLLVAFTAYAVVTSPTRAAEVVKSGGSSLQQGAEGIGSFFDSLLA
jgi:hypothetical protein